MATSATAKTAGVFTKSWEVVFGADGDTSHDITHGFSAAPDEVLVVPIGAKADDQQVSVTWDATKVTVAKNSTAAGSGDAAAQVRIVALVLHSLVK